MEAARGVKEKTLEWHEVARDGRRGDRRTVDVAVPAGVDTGMQIRLSGKGGEGDRGAPAGDLFVQVEVEPDPYPRPAPKSSFGRRRLRGRATSLAAAPPRDPPPRRYYYWDSRAQHAYYSFGDTITLQLAMDDLDAIKASAVAADGASSWLSASTGAISDMTGNGLAATGGRKPGAGYIADATLPKLSAFDLDLDQGTLNLEFDESVDDDTLDLTKVLLTPDGVRASGTTLIGGGGPRDGPFWARGVYVVRGNASLSNEVYVALGETNLDAIKQKRLDAGKAFLAADAGAAADMAGLEMARITPADVEGGAPLAARSVVADETQPALRKANIAGNDLVLTFSEPVAFRAATKTSARPSEMRQT